MKQDATKGSVENRGKQGSDHSYYYNMLGHPSGLHSCSNLRILVNGKTGF